jgi:hypothetical protein
MSVHTIGQISILDHSQWDAELGYSIGQGQNPDAVFAGTLLSFAQKSPALKCP